METRQLIGRNREEIGIFGEKFRGIFDIGLLLSSRGGRKRNIDFSKEVELSISFALVAKIIKE